MPTLRPRLALLSLLVGLSASLSACNACSDDAAKDEAKASPKQKVLAKKKGKGKKDGKRLRSKLEKGGKLAKGGKGGKGGGGMAKGPKGNTETPPASGVSAVVLSGDDAMLWTEGTTGKLTRPAAKVRWSARGFEWDDDGGIQVLAPGGARYWVAGAAEGRPLNEVVTTESATAPDGYAIETFPGARGMVRLSLKAPGDRVVRIGMLREQPKGTGWFSGSLPAGTAAAPSLTDASPLARSASGLPTTAAPTGWTAVASAPVADDRLAAWKKDLGILERGSSAITVVGSWDLDGDAEAETLLCVAKGPDSGSCYVVDIVAGVARFHPVALPWNDLASANPPIAAKDAEHSYVLWAVPHGGPGREGDPELHSLFFDGGAFEVIRLN